MIAFVETVLMAIVFVPAIVMLFALAWIFPAKNVLDGLG